MRVAELDMHPPGHDGPPGQGAGRGRLGYRKSASAAPRRAGAHQKITDNALILMKERVADRKYDPSCGWQQAVLCDT